MRRILPIVRSPQAVIDRVLLRHWFDFGYLHLKQGDPKLAYEAFLRCIRLRPMRVKAWINMARSFVKQTTKPKLPSAPDG